MSALKSFKCIFLTALGMLLPFFTMAQNGDEVTNMLVDMGFENVAWAENEEERVYVLENSVYRLSGAGVGKALEKIQKYGLPAEGKICRLIVLENNVPQVSLSCIVPVDANSGKLVTKDDWKVSYDLGQSWEMVKGRRRKNSSLYKIDLLFCPEFSFRNSRLSVPYQVKLNINPTLQVSLWKGGTLTAQIVVPVVNDYGYKYASVRPGFLTLSHTVRLPHNIFVTGTAGFFSNERFGFDAASEYHFNNERFWIDGRISYTLNGEWGEWEYSNGKMENLHPFKLGYSIDNKVTGQLGVNYYWKRFNTQMALRGESFLGGECGVRLDLIRHFRYCSIGLYGICIPSDSWNNGVNAGFRFQITLPPYKYKRKGYVPRVMPGRNWGFSYNAGGTFIYGQRFKADINDNINDNIKYNPVYLGNGILDF